MTTFTEPSTPKDAIRDLETALRREDRSLAEKLLLHAAEKGWKDVAPAAVTYLEHHRTCPAERIELTDYTKWTRVGEPGYGVVTTHCNDCGAHRAHDPVGLPLVPADPDEPATTAGAKRGR